MTAMSRQKILFASLVIVSTSAAADFIHPLEFDNSDVQKNQVIAWIEAKVKKTYCSGPVNMCQESTLRMMEKSEIKAFKGLTEAKDRATLDSVIGAYCNGGPRQSPTAIDLCSYSNLQMMYKQEIKSKVDKTEW